MEKEVRALIKQLESERNQFAKEAGIVLSEKNAAITRLYDLLGEEPPDMQRPQQGPPMEMVEDEEP